MTDTSFINDRLAAMNASAETRARAMQAAYIGESVSAALAAVGRTAATLYRRWREWSETRRSIAYLEGLDERLLADIGLSHATLEETLHRSAKTNSPVDAMIAETAPAKTAANQDHPARRHAA